MAKYAFYLLFRCLLPVVYRKDTEHISKRVAPISKYRDKSKTCNPKWKKAPTHILKKCDLRVESANIVPIPIVEELK